MQTNDRKRNVQNNNRRNHRAGFKPSFHLAGLAARGHDGRAPERLAWRPGLAETTIALIRETLPELPILLDIPGRKIRTIQLRVEPSFKTGDRLILTTDLSHDGSQKVPVNYAKFHEKLRAGVRIYADDGTLSFQVAEVEGPDVHVVAETDGTLKSRKGINVPEIDLGQELVTPRDRDMIAFARRVGVDFVGISFVESARHVEAIRALIDAPTPQIVAKVENQGGLDHLDEIAGATDTIMIDRGDLSVETSIDHVSIHQKTIIAAAQRYGKPVIVATELLHGMIESPLPTKAEIGDVTNSVIDGASAVMLSGETAVGRFPVEAVARLRSIVTLAEGHRHAVAPPLGGVPTSRLDLRAATQALARSLPITRIVVLSRTGYAARLVSMAQVQQPIIALILLGFVLRQRRLLADAFWLPCETLNYYYMFPVLMFSQVARANLTQFPIRPIAIAILGAVGAGALLLYGWRLWSRQPGAVFSSVIQGSLRPNTYVGVAAAAAMYGSVGLTLTSISIAVAIPLLNVASVVILMRYGSGGAPTPGQVLNAVLKNPVIMAVLLGALFNLGGLTLPATLSSLLSILGAASLPLGLLAVGAGLDMQAARAARGPVLQSSFIKLLLVPLLTLWIGVSLGIHGPALTTIVLFNSLPCTPSAYIMAKLLGGDHRLSAGIITVQTALAAITMPLVLLVSHR